MLQCIDSSTSTVRVTPIPKVVCRRRDSQVCLPLKSQREAKHHLGQQEDQRIESNRIEVNLMSAGRRIATTRQQYPRLACWNRTLLPPPENRRIPDTAPGARTCERHPPSLEISRSSRSSISRADTRLRSGGHRLSPFRLSYSYVTRKRAQMVVRGESGRRRFYQNAQMIVRGERERRGRGRGLRPFAHGSDLCFQVDDITSG